ncbi:MAG: 7,8-didemethyl-8-hydroxy-5-deazariboflavin synthase subunit CofG, partial [Alcaligenaceae bacterium]
MTISTEREIARAVNRAEAGKSIDLDEAGALLAARGPLLVRLMAVASRIRDAGLESANRPDVLTYSRKVFIPLTHLCQDRCHYCTFATTPGKLTAQGRAPFLSQDEVLDIARRGAELGCKEALFTLGDRPENRWPEARRWLEEAGYASTLEYVRAMAVLVLEDTGLLPHLNPGVMTWAEIARLKPVAPSMGMMLETTSRRLFETRGEAHYKSPDKDPSVRVRVLEDAGRLNVPFTTGILLGIGETLSERAETLFELRRIHRDYGSIQEVVVQNFRSKPDTAMRHRNDLEFDEYLAAIATARVVLGPSIRVQAPPNLVDLAECGTLIDAGIDDFGGISPLTPDHVNPERPWPEIEQLSNHCATKGFRLRERLTAHPTYLKQPWLDPRVQKHVDALRGPDGLADPAARSVGIPWQEPDGGVTGCAQGWGRTDLQESIDTDGRSADRRGDFDVVFGDWATLRMHARSSLAPSILGSDDVVAALHAAERAPARLTEQQAFALMAAEGVALEAVCALADDLRRDAVGETVTYVVNRNINFTNVCYTGCRFCAFAQRKSDADAYSLSLTEISKRAIEAV